MNEARSTSVAAVPPRRPGPTGASSLAAEMEHRWRLGNRLPAEELLNRQPGLWQQPDAALALIYQEIGLRLEAGEALDPAEFGRRFPRWARQLEALLDCQRVLDARAATPPRLPEVGEHLHEFRLIARLGSGAQGSVFLAEQSDLGGRPVVLKITPCDGHEHLALARLQHTHIVPLYAARHDLRRDLRILCMPYFGCTTLGRVLDEVAKVPVGQRAGQHLLDILDRAQAGVPVRLPQRGPGREVLARASYVQAVCWIGACLADALQYAHERGLVHLDLKPSNVLLAADGQPMLLDFHLAQPPLRPDGPPPEWLGGTPLYMPPEQKAALAAVREDRPVAETVDGRADLFSLGTVLYSALGGRLPFVPGTSPPLCRLNRDVSVGLSDLVARCLAAAARDRYVDAASLAADLRRHLADQPLQGVPNRSLAERWRKWRRRQPYRLAQGALLLTILVAALGFGLNALGNSRQQADEARALLTEGRAQLERGHADLAAVTLRRGLTLAKQAPLQADLRRTLSEELGRAEAAGRDAEYSRAAHELHELADRLRLLSGADVVPSHSARLLEARCRALWARHDDIVRHLGDREPLRNDLLDLAVLGSDLQVRLASAPEAAPARRDALRTLAAAEALLGPSPVLYRERQAHAAALGQLDMATEAGRRAGAVAPRTAWEHYALALSLLRVPCVVPAWSGAPDSAAVLVASLHLVRATASLERAVALDPNGVWPNYYLGLCAYRCGRYEDAVSAFSVCVGAASDKAGFYHCRALAHAALGHAERALQDHHHARRLDPDAAPAAAVHYNLAVAHLRRGAVAAAVTCLDAALCDDPNHAAARILRQQLQH